MSITAAPPTSPARPSPWGNARRRLASQGLLATLARGSLRSFYMNVLGTALSFGNQIVLARALSVAEYGVYLYVLAGMNLALIFARLEFDVSAVRFVAALTGQAQWATLRGFLRRSRQIVLASSLVISVVAALAVWWWTPPLAASVARAYWVVCAILPLTALLMLHGSYLQGFRRIALAQAPALVVRPFLLGAGVLATTWVLGRSLDASGALLISLMATAAALGVTAWWVKGAVPPQARAATPIYETRTWVTTSAGLLFIALAQVALAHQTDLIVVGSLISTDQAALYGVASQMSALVSFGTIAIVFVMLPVVSDLHARGRRRDLQRLVVTATRAMLVVSLPVYLGLILFGRALLRLYGPSYEAAYGVLVLLATATLSSAAAGHFAGFLLTMTGHQNQALAVFIGTGLLNLSMTSWMTPMFGIVGAATASAVATTVKNLMLVWWATRYVGVRVTFLRVGAPPEP